MSVILGMFDGTRGERHEAGATIFSRGDPGDRMYVLLEGEVELRIGERTIDVLRPGEPFGEMALIDSEARVATAVARTACRLAPVTEKQFLELIQDTPYFGLEIMKVMAHRLRKMNASAAAL